MDARVLGDRYELRERIGSGGMGTVWRAHDRTMGRYVAVKLLHEGLAADSTFGERFRAEARSAARLTHPHVVAVFDTGEQDGIPYIVMELVEGKSLHTVLADHGPLPVNEVARLGRAITGALAHAHGRGLIHRDMKPANVLLEDGSREPKVADFGIAKGLEDTAGLTRTGGLIGTAAYLSPEQVSGHPATPASDVYAVGCLLYACLVGEPPFEGGTAVAVAMRHLQDQVPPLRQRRPDVPEPFAGVVHRALEKDPSRRYANAQQMQEAIETTGLGAGPPTDLGAAATVQVMPAAAGGTTPMSVRTSTQVIDRPAPPPSRAVRVLAAVSAALIAAAAVWLATTWLQTRANGPVDDPLTTSVPTLPPEQQTEPQAEEEPTPSPESPSPEPTPAEVTPEGGPQEFPDLPGFDSQDEGSEGD